MAQRREGWAWCLHRQWWGRALVYLLIAAMQASAVPPGYAPIPSATAQQPPPATPLLQVGTYQLISEVRITRTIFEYTYRATVTNSGASPFQSVIATVASLSSATQIVDGNLSFGDVPAGGTVASQDTFSFRQDRNKPFNPADLLWSFAFNRPPVANAGPDQTVPPLARVQLSGAQSSDPDGDALSYQWTFVSRPGTSNATLSAANLVSPTFDIDVPGTYVLQLVVNDGKGNSTPDEVRISTENSRPIARAGPGQTVKVTDTATLNGSASSDADGDPLAFRWQMVSRPAGSVAQLAGANTVGPTFVADRPGQYVVELVVNDGKVDSVPARVTVTTENSSPVANPGPDQRIHAGASVQLTGAGSTDVDGDPLTYAWTFASRPDGSNATIAPADGVAPRFLADLPGVYVAQLIVNDGKVSSAPRTVTLTSENVAPVANAGPDQTVPLGALVALAGCDSSDADGDRLTYQWSITTRPAGSLALPSDPAQCNATFTADKPGTYIAQLIVDDGYAGGVADTVVVSTLNSTPIANAGPDKHAERGDSVRLEGCGSNDPDGAPLTYVWSFTTRPQGSNAAFTNASVCNPMFTADLAGDYVAQLIVNDGTANSTPDTAMITVIDVAAPVAASDQYTTPQGVALTVAVPGVLGNDTVAPGKTLSAVLVNPPTPAQGAVTLLPAGGFTFTPAAGFSGTASFSYQAGDGVRLSNIATVTIAVTIANRPPVITSAPVATAAVGQLYSYQVTATDPDAGDVLAFALASAPQGMTIDSANGLARWTPAASQVGLNSVTVRVTDKGGLFAEQTFDIAVAPAPPVNNPPEITFTGITPQWTKLAPTGTPPNPRHLLGSASAYDEINDRLMFFGGDVYVPIHDHPSEVWVLVNASGVRGPPEWVKLAPLGTLPPGRHSNSLVYDPTANRLILYGGCNGHCPSLYGDVWALTNANGLGGTPEWIQLSSGAALAGHAAGYDPASNRMIVFGGFTSGPGSDSNAIRILADANGIGDPKWLNPIVDGTPPPPRGHWTNAVYDPLTNRLIVFGGTTTRGAQFNDAWVLHNANAVTGNPRWEQLSPAGTPPSPRGDHSMIYDANSNRLVAFGGFDQAESPILFNNETWTLTNANGSGGTPEWIRQVTPQPLPAPRGMFAAGYSRALNRLVVAMGRNDREPLQAGSYNDAWVLANASGLCTAGQPCRFSVMATDPDAGDVLSYALDAAPAGMAIDAATGAVLWTPEIGQIGNHTVTLRVTDRGGLFAARTFPVTVVPVAVPNVVGLAPEWAQSFITAVDLTVGTKTSQGGAVTLNFNSLPSRQGWTYKNSTATNPNPGVTVPESQVFSLVSGMLHQDAFGICTPAYYSLRDAVNARLPFSFSMRARVTADQGNPTPNPFGFAVEVWTVQDENLLGFSSGQISDNINIFGFDNRSFHDYAMTGRSGQNYRLSIDGTERFIGAVSQLGQSDRLSLLLLGRAAGCGGVGAQADVLAFSFTQPRVVGQNPPPGTLVPNKTAVDLTIVDGPATETVPNLTGLTQAQASAAITAANLTVGAVNSAPSNTIPAGQVSDQSPLPNIRVPKNTPVNIVMSTGPPPPPPNRAPTITSTPVLAATVGQSYAYQVTATDPDVGDALTLSLQTAPLGMTISPTGLVQWAPAANQLGRNNVTVRVTDRGGLLAEQTFEIAVAPAPPVNNPPAITFTGITPQWTKLAPIGTPPTAKYIGSLQTYDEINDRLIAFGGLNATSERLNDVWVLTKASGLGGAPEWVQLAPTGTGPSPRSAFVSAYDPTANRLIVYGGCSAFCAQLSDVWVLTHANGLGGVPEWLPLPSSTNLGFGVGGYDPVSNRMVVYGGFSGGTGSDSNEVKVLVDANGIGEPKWTPLSPVGTPPPQRGHDQPGVYDPLSNSLIIFGGMSSGGTTYNDVFVLSHANGIGGVPTWSPLNPAGSSPPPSAGHSLAYDPNSNRLIVFGGGAAQFLNDTWVLTHANGQGGVPEWIKLTSGPAPEVSQSPTVGYARSSNRFIAALGLGTGKTPINDVWVLASASGNCIAGQACTFKVTASDPDAGDGLTYALDAAPSGMSIDAATGTMIWTPAIAQIGDHAVTVRVTDKGGLFATQTFTATAATVAVPNVVGLAPEWAESFIGAADLTVGTKTSQGGAVTLNFDSLPSRQGWNFYSSGPTEVGRFSIGGGLLHQDTIGIGGNFAGYKIDNSVVRVLDPRLPLSVSARLRVLAEEAGTQINSYGLALGVWNVGEIFLLGFGTDRIGLYEGTINNRTLAHDNTGFHDYVLRGVPGAGFQLLLDGILFHEGPRLVSTTGDYTLFVGDPTTGPNVRGEIAAYSFTQPRVVGQNPPPGTLVPNKTAVDLTIVDGPATETVPNLTGLTQAQASAAITAANLTVGAVNSAPSNTIPAGQVSDQSPLPNIRVPKNTPVNIVMSTGPPGNVAPVITSVPVLTATVGQPYGYQVTATDANTGDVLAFTLPVAPAGMTINATSGLIQWTPSSAQVGQQNVTVRVTDKGGLFATQSFNVTARAGNTPPIAVAGLVNAPGVPSCVAPPGGLVSWYPGDGTSIDIVGPNSPTATIGSPQFVAGKVGQAIRFDGNSGLIVPHNPTINFGATDSFTIDTWIRVDGRTGGGADAFIDKRENFPKGRGYLMDAILAPSAPAGMVYFRIQIVDTHAPDISGTASTRPVPIGQFHHIAGVVDRIKKTIAIYLDGVLDQELSIANVGDISSVSRLFIGQHNADIGTGERQLDGVLDELGIFNRALTQSEVQSIFLAGAAGKCKLRVGETVKLDGTQSSDPDGDTLSYRWTLLAAPAGSAAALSDPNALQPTFVADTPGTYRVRLVVNDGVTDSPASEIAISVSDANRPPIALDDVYTVTLGSALSVPAPGVIANDYDPDGNPLAAAKLTDPPNGSLALNSDGAFSYTPNPNVFGPGASAHTLIGTTFMPGQPKSIAVNPAMNRIYVTNLFADSLAVIDGANGKVLALPTTNFSHIEDVAVNAVTNRLYVTGTAIGNYIQSTTQLNEVTVIDGTTHTRIAAIPVGAQPGSLAVNAAANRVYVANVAANSVSVIDGASNAVIATIPVGSQPRQVRVNAKSNRVYVLSALDNSVSVIDAGANAVIATVPVGADPRFMLVDPDLARVYVANFGANSVSVIDAASNAVNATFMTGAGPSALALHPVSERLYVANSGADSVTVVDRNSGASLGTIPVGTTPQSLALNPFTNRVYVANTADNTISVIDTIAGSVSATVPVGRNPAALAVNLATDRVYTSDADSHSVSVVHVGDRFSYKVSDGLLDSNAATVTVVIEPQIVAPIAVNDRYQAGGTLTVPAPGVLANDADAAGKALTAALVSGPSSGSLALNPDGSFSYTPLAGFSGSVTFTYKANSGTTDSNTATVTIAVTATSGNQPPVITSTAATTATVGLLYSYQATATDPNTGDVLAFSVPTAPSGMTINPTTGLTTWTPSVAQVGPNNVTVRVTDPGGLFGEQSFVVTVVAAPPSQVSVPNVIGRITATAQATILNAQLSVGVVTTRDADEALAFDTLPSGQNWLYGAFGNSASESSVFSLANGILTQNTLATGAGGLNVYQRPGIVDASKPFALTVTARVLAQNGDPADPFGFGFGAVTSTEQIAVGLRTDGIYDSLGNKLSGSIDTTQFHAYRLEQTPGVGYRLFVDGVLLGTGTNVPRTTPTDAFLILGDMSAGANAHAEIKGFSFVQRPGVVIAQNPAAGAGVPVGSAVDLVAVRALATVVVPNVAGQLQADAISALVGAKLLVGTIATQNNPTVAAGRVISHSPAGGASAPEFTVVNLVVSLGPLMVAVPNVVGQAQTAALAAIVNAQLAAGTVTTQASATVPSGNIISQNPAAGTVVTAGTAVNLIVSSGPAPLTLASIIVTPASTVTVTGNTLAYTATGVRPDGSSLALTTGVTWASGNAAAASIDGGGIASALAAGTTTISATAQGVTGTATLKVEAAVANGSLPTVQITAPADGATISSALTVTGTASDPELLKYVLEIAPVGTNTFTKIAEGTAPVVNGPLGTLDPTLLVNDLYTLRLTAIDRGNNQQSTQIVVQVAREKKVGNFTLAFQDVNVPMAGIPISVVRSYDSRDKAKGDFGIGWRLDVNSLRLRVIGIEGQGWQQTQSGGVLDRTYTITPTTKHFVAITLPDGKVEEFDFTISPTQQVFSPIQVVTPSYTPRSLTRGTLRAVGATPTLETSGTLGDLEFYPEGSFGNVFVPQAYDYITPEGQTIRITRAGMVQSITDRNGNTVTFGPTGIIHSAGKSIAFQRDAQGRITRVTDPLGNAQTYAYDENGDLAAHTDAEGNATSFLYNYTHGLIEIRDPRGVRAIRNEYDDAGRLISTTDAFGKTITYTHDLANSREIITDRLGRPVTHVYDDQGNVTQSTDALGGVTTRTYDARGNTLTETDTLGRTRSYTYDAQDNRLTETDPLGNTTTYTYNGTRQVLSITDALGRVTSNVYDAAGNLTRTTDPLGQATNYTYDGRGLQLTRTDPLGNVTRYAYDGAGNLMTETDALGRVTTYTYDANGNRASQSTIRTTAGGPETLTTRYTYDALNRLTQTTHPDGTVTRTEYNAIGKQARALDQLGRATAYEYDDMGRLSRTTYPDGASESSAYDAEGRRTGSTDRAGRTTNYAYDALGRLTATTFPDGARTTTAYDAAGQVLSSADARGNATTYQYDGGGRRIRVTDAAGAQTSFNYDAVGNQIGVTDANGNALTFTYDASNRRTRSTYADGTFDQVAYDTLGRQIAKTDPAGKATQFAYDTLGRLIRVTDALGQVTGYTYDERGNQLTQTDAEGRTTRFEYDKLGRRAKRILPLGQMETYAYDAAGNLGTKTDFNGKVTSYQYDAVNRLTRKSPDASLAQPPITFTYTVTGQRAAMQDASGTTNYTYDQRDRLLTRATPQGTLTYTYDPAGNLASIVSSNANGVSVNYAYDVRNRLATVTDNRNTAIGGGVTTYTYDAVGNLKDFVYPNGVETAYTYNPLNRLTNVTGKKIVDLASFTYTLGAAGNRTSVTELSGRKVDYTYDVLYRLTGETITADPTPARNGQIGYVYDNVGNRLTRTSTQPAIAPQSFTYDANDRITAESYDDNGNAIGSTGKTYGYDFENRLTSAPTDGATFVYNGDGIRVAKTAGAVTTSFLVDDRNPTGYAQVLEEIVGGSVARSYTYGLKLVSQKQASGVSFYGYDGHGSVRYLTDAAGVVTDTYTYDAFGNLLYREGTTSNVYLHGGEQSDPNVGFYYLRARYLNQRQGRFLSQDIFEGRAESPSSLHDYVYAVNNPAMFLDPSGRFVIALEAASILQQEIFFNTPRVLSGWWRSRGSSIELQKGDVLLELGNSTLYGNWPAGLSAVIAGGTFSRYSHAAIVTEVRPNWHDATVTESLGNTGVKRTSPLLRFLRDSVFTHLYRVRAPASVRALAADRATGFLGLPYDMRLDQIDDSAIFCSELVWKAYRYGTGLDIAGGNRTFNPWFSALPYSLPYLLTTPPTLYPYFVAPGDIAESSMVEFIGSLPRF